MAARNDAKNDWNLGKLTDETKEHCEDPQVLEFIEWLLNFEAQDPLNTKFMAGIREQLDTYTGGSSK